MSRKKDRGLVYSSEGGRMCPGCDQPVDNCRCGQAGAGSGGDGTVRVARETKGRRGKAVTVVTGAPGDALELADLAKQLKNLCGAGGTVKADAIEIQGDHRDRIVAELQQRGWTVKKAGG